MILFQRKIIILPLLIIIATILSFLLIKDKSNYLILLQINLGVAVVAFMLKCLRRDKKIRLSCKGQPLFFINAMIRIVLYQQSGKQIRLQHFHQSQNREQRFLR